MFGIVFIDGDLIVWVGLFMFRFVVVRYRYVRFVILFFVRGVVFIS